MLGSDRKYLPDLSLANAAACFKKTGIEKQTMAWTYVDSRIPGRFHDTSRIRFAGRQRFFHIHVCVVPRGNSGQRTVGSRRCKKMNNVRLNLAHHLFHVRVYTGNVVASCLIACHILVEIAHSNDLNIR